MSYPIPIWVLVPAFAVGCAGGTSEAVAHDRALQEELAREEGETRGGEEEPAPENVARLRAGETRVYRHCYESVDHLPAHVAERRRVRFQRADRGRGGEMGHREHHARPNNTDADADANAYPETELALIILEDQYDVFHETHPDPSAWTGDELDEFEDLVDALVRSCGPAR